jgi:hypothetical protein
MVLAGLRNIEWGKLQGCYDPAKYVPDWLEALLSNDEEVMEAAFDDLSDNLLHQCTVYEATAYAVPFLLEILQHQTPISAAWYNTLSLIASIANGGTDQDEVQDRIDEGLKQGIPVFLSLLQNPDEDIVLVAAQILVHFSDELHLIASAFRSAIHALHDPAQRGHLLILFGALLEGVAVPCTAALIPHAIFVEPYLSPNQPEIIRLGAAHVHFAVYRAISADAVIEILCDALTLPDSHETNFIFFIDYYPPDNITDCFARLPNSRILPPLLTHLLRVKDTDVIHDVIRFLLERVFGEKTVDHPVIMSFASASYPVEKTSYEIALRSGAKANIPPASLTLEQRMFFEALANFDLFWKIKTNLLEVFGLPGKRDDLRVYLAEQGAS